MHASTQNPELQNSKEHSEAISISITFVVLCFLLSSPFWYLKAQLPTGSKTTAVTIGYMWCPTLAALLTRLIYRRNLKGLGFTLGKVRWLALALLLPALAGLLMYGSAWLLDIAPFDDAKVHKFFALSFIPVFFGVLGFSTFAALGEELGWRGLLVPELSRRMGYTKVSLVSGIIWTAWHLPLMFFSGYNGAGPLWVSLVYFTLYVLASSFIHTWMRLVSGSVWVSALLHGSSNYFILVFYPTFTTRTPKGEAMLGEFGWAAPILSVAIAVVFWCYRSRIPRNAGRPTKSNQAQ